MTKSDRIRELLARGLSIKEIAKRVSSTTNLVHQVKWQAKNGRKKKKVVKAAKPSKILKAVKEMKQALDVIEKKPTLKMRSWVEANKPQRVMINLARRKDGAIIDLNKGGEVISLPDPVNHPPHYKSGGVETIDFIEAKDLNYRLGNVVKDVSRAGRKATDPIEDLKKAAWYLQREIAARENA